MSSGRLPSIKELRREWLIPKNGEFRFEVNHTEVVSFKLLSGNAEVYGMELCQNREYEVRGVKLSIFSYEGGAKVLVRGKCDVEYISEESVMPIYLNTHLAIEGMRREAVSRGGDSHRILLLGSSRNTVSRILTNYAVRAGKTPIYVDLDVNNGSISIPGILGAQVIEKVIDVEEGIVEGGQPIMYFYGSPSPLENAKLYRKTFNRLAFAVNGKLATLNDALKSGAIIVPPGECEEFVEEIVENFKVDLLLVVGNERLHSNLTKVFPNKIVLKLPKSGGFVTKDNSFRRLHQQAQYHKCFYGPKNEYSPFTVILNSDEVFIRRLGEEVLAPKSALPLGATRKIDESKSAVKVEPTSSNILYSILGLSLAGGEEQLGDANIAGFVYVTAVDEGKKQITVLSMCPGKLPSPWLLAGNLKWIEK